MTGLPDWLDPLPDAGEQRALDGWAIERHGIAGEVLMERAGAGLAELAAELVPEGDIAVVCGKGNNGGDGLVAARILRQRGREIRVLLVADEAEIAGDARLNLERLPGEAPQPFSPAALGGAAGIVDALLGTGFAGSPRAPLSDAIEAIDEVRQRSRARIVACDVPSGVDASTGEALGAAVRADATATFHAAKPGLWINPGKTRAGRVQTIAIGIPPGGPARPCIGLITSRVLAQIPTREADSTKFAAGSVLVCGGSTGLTGAPCMASAAAMRAGAGYVTVCGPASLNLIFEVRLLEVMSAPLPDEDGALVPAAVDPVLERAGRVDAVILGPGLGRAAGTQEFARELARRLPGPLLLDADGLGAHRGEPERLAGRSGPTVLTPHAGELARLLGCESSEVAERRLARAREAADAARAVVVLKGDDSIVAAPDGRVGISAGGASALATAGTGDVLSGVIGACLAKGMEPFAAACAGVFVHAEAGRILQARRGPEGIIASDVIEVLPEARRGGAG